MIAPRYVVMQWIEDGSHLLWVVENGHLHEGGTKTIGTSDEDNGECRRNFCVKEQEGQRKQMEATWEARHLPPPGL